MKFIGRILLIVAGVWLLVNAVPGLIDAIKGLNAAGWQNIFANQANIDLFVILLVSGFYILFALSALFGALRGRKSFGMAIAALIMIAYPIYLIVTGFQSGNAQTGQFWYSLISGFALPIIYFFGFLLV